MSRDWAVQKGESVWLTLWVQPKAARNEIVGAVLGADGSQSLKVRIEAPPVEGAANAEVIRYFRKLLRKCSSSVELVSGQLSRHKVLELRGSSRDEVVAVLRGAFTKSQP